MLRRSQRFPISDGTIVTTLRDGLTTWTGLTVGTDVPEVKTRRMVTVRDDSGLATGRVQPRRQGINVWADSDVDALNIALDAMHICESDLPTGGIVAAAGQFTGPFRIPEDTPYTAEVAGETKPLTHYYFTFVATVKAVAV